MPPGFFPYPEGINREKPNASALGKGSHWTRVPKGRQNFGPSDSGRSFGTCSVPPINPKLKHWPIFTTSLRKKSFAGGSNHSHAFRISSVAAPEDGRAPIAVFPHAHFLTAKTFGLKLLRCRAKVESLLLVIWKSYPSSRV